MIVCAAHVGHGNLCAVRLPGQRVGAPLWAGPPIVVKVCKQMKMQDERQTRGAASVSETAKGRRHDYTLTLPNYTLTYPPALRSIKKPGSTLREVVSGRFPGEASRCRPCSAIAPRQPHACEHWMSDLSTAQTRKATRPPHLLPVWTDDWIFKA